MSDRYKQFQSLIDTLDMSQVGVAKFLDVSQRTTRRWAAQGNVPLAYLMLLEVMVRKRVRPADARRFVGATQRGAQYQDQRRSL